MPVEIKELVVRAEVVTGAGAAAASASTVAETLAREELLAACVAQVLAVLEKRTER